MITSTMLRMIEDTSASEVTVLREFEMDGANCWVVQLSGAGHSDPIFEPSFGAEICRFEVNGQVCVIIRAIEPQPAEAAPEDLTLSLSARESQIAALVALGYPNKLVAQKLRISEWTVATYLRRIFAKLGVESRAAMTFRCASLIEKQQANYLTKPNF